MSLVRFASVSLSLAAFASIGPAHAQYRQPWTGKGIPALLSPGGGQVLVTDQKAFKGGVTKSADEMVKSTRFIIRVENISRGEVLKSASGQTAPFVSAPVFWAVHTTATNPIFVAGERDTGLGLELLAETGEPTHLVKKLGAKSGLVSVGGVAVPVGTTIESPLMPGQSYEFEIVARPGQFFSSAWMFGQSNDLFYSNDRPIALFTTAGKPVSGDMTTQLALWDTGTEVNEEPGFGPNQGPRQKMKDDGVRESEGIAHVRDQYGYPQIADVLRLTIAPAGDAVSAR